MISFNSVRTRIPVKCISIFVFLFSALALIVPSGYTYGPALLLVAALFYLFVRPYPTLITADKYLIVALLIYFLVGCITNIAHNLPTRNFDNISRFLFAIPVLLLLLRLPIIPVYLWAGIALGALGAGVIATIDFYVYGELRAGRYNNPIQFGDIAMLFACLLLAGFLWARQHSRIMMMFFAVGIMGGVLASLLSGARGGWLILPFALASFFFANNLQKNITKSAIFITVVLGVTGFIYYFFLHGFLLSRVNDAISDLQQYFYANNANTSLGVRISLWRASLPLIAAHPLIGWGSVDNYVRLSGDSANIFQFFNHFHNDILDALVKRGIFGGFALLIIYVVPGFLFYRQLKQCEPEKLPYIYAGLMLVLATFVFGLTQSCFSHSSGVMIYVFMVVILWAKIRTSDENKEI